MSLLLLPMAGIAAEGWRAKNVAEAVEESLTTLSLKVAHAPSDLASRRTEYEQEVRRIAGSSARLVSREFCLCSSEINSRGLSAPERSCSATCPSWNGVSTVPGRWIEFTVTAPYTPVVSFGPLKAQTFDGKTRVRTSG